METGADDSAERVRSGLGRIGEFAVEKVNAAVANGSGFRTVGDEDEGNVQLVGDFLEQVQNLFAVHGIEISRGLVRENHGRPMDQGAGDGNALLFTSRELAGKSVRTVFQSHASECGVDTSLAFTPSYVQ